MQFLNIIHDIISNLSLSLAVSLSSPVYDRLSLSLPVEYEKIFKNYFFIKSLLKSD